jgi:hypothetical protein
VCALFSCNKSKDDQAARTAEQYMRYLISGNYDKYVEARADYDSLPDSYRSQLIDMTKQYMADEKEERGGIRAVRAVSDTIDGNVANVLLSVRYGNDSIEEILFPLILVKGKWLMP